MQSSKINPFKQRKDNFASNWACLVKGKAFMPGLY